MVGLELLPVGFQHLFAYSNEMALPGYFWIIGVLKTWAPDSFLTA